MFGCRGNTAVAETRSLMWLLGAVLCGCVRLASLLATIVAMRMSLLLVAVAILSGCMLGPYPDHVLDYRPQTLATSRTYYQCLQDAQQPYAGGRFAAGGGTAYGAMSSGVVTSSELVCACMGAHGYTLRRATGGEVAVDAVLLPIEVPFALLGAQGSLIDGACP